MEYTINTRISVRTNNTTALEKLMNDIRKYDTMTADEEMQAFEELASAKTEVEKYKIKERIANANLRFVLSVAKKYSNDGDRVAELVSLGTIGLYRAMENFDSSKGFKFISHAIHWIRAEYSEFFRNNANLVRRSNNSKIGMKDKHIAERFFQTEMREPTEDELIDALKAEYGIEVKNKMDVVKVKTSYINERINSEDDSTMESDGEFAMATASHNEYEDEIEREDASAKVTALLSQLPIREQDIMCRYYGIGRDAQDAEVIGEAYGLCAERVRQLVMQEIPAKIRKGKKVA